MRLSILAVLLCLALSQVALEAKAERYQEPVLTSLSLPIYTNHIMHPGEDGKYNDNVFGVGLLFQQGANELGFLYLKEDSFENENLIVYAGQRFRFTKNLYATAGVSYGFNYDVAMPLPMIGMQYRNIKVVTTMPFDYLIKEADTTLVHIQFVMPFGRF